MIVQYKLKFAEKLAAFFSMSVKNILPLIQLAPDNVP
jgi:hypothetical protein